MREIGRPRRPWDRTPVGEREYFDLLGPGLVAVALPRRPGGGGAEGWSPPTGGAWIHVGADGEVIGFTGKAEVGQGTRTALTLVVAEELRLPPERIELVMADTDLCPWDMGTFGSRSMPDAAPALAAASARAREALVELASERDGSVPSALIVSDGEVRRAGEARGVPYGSLVNDLRRTVTTDRPAWPSRPSDWTRAGRPTVDLHADDVVTGRRRYTSDLSRPGLLHGAILHPPSYGSRLAGLEETPPAGDAGAIVVHEGDFVGAVADGPRRAREALARLRPVWRTHASPGPGEIEEYLRTHTLSSGDSWDTDERVVGDVDSALSNAPIALTMTYRTAYIAHVPLETHCAIAEWDGSRVTVWVGTQTPFRVRDEVAGAFSLPPEAVRIVVPPTGSGFGGKHGGSIAVAAARLARSVGRPVRVANTREEEFRHAYFRPMAIIDVAVGAERDGRLVAWRFRNVNAGSAALFPPYRIANLAVDNVLSESPLPQGSYRSLAAATNNFARESAVDEVARRVGADPVTLRLANIEDERLRAVLERAAERSHWRESGRRPGHGRGVAVGLEKGSRVATVAEVTAREDGKLVVDRLVCVFEAGAIVNPDNLRSQVEGALVMGLGGALFEAIAFDAGVVKNASLAAYRVPRFSDLPEIDVELVDRRDLPPAGGGETPMIAVAPAVANAIADACGVRLRSLPLVPDGRVPLAPSGAGAS